VAGGEIFTRDYILWHPLHSGIRFDLQATTLTLTFWIQNQEASTDCQGLPLCQVTSHSDQGFSFYCVLTYTPVHTYRDKVTAVSASPYGKQIARHHSCHKKVLAKARGTPDLWRFSSHLVWFDHLCKILLLWVIQYEPTLWRCWILVPWDSYRAWLTPIETYPPNVLQCSIWSF